ncbi:MAG: hypothetical protein E7409_03365 [Ruminococcaceae bacterium]|nr:hypothetical protein [Oscillospiraceae bacterium]
MFQIYCAAFDSPEELKRKADFICDEKDARPTLQEAIDKADELNVSCVLAKGTYIINSRGERSPRGAICFYNPEPAKRFYAQNCARYHTLEGTKAPIGYLDGAVITMGREFYDSLSDTEEFSLFYNDGGDSMGRGMFIRNLTVKLPDCSKPVIVFDGRFAGAVRYEDTWVSSFDPEGKNYATAEGIPVPHIKSVAFRGCHGSNFYSTEMKNCAAAGFGTGFDIGGEHVYCESLSALYNHYGFAFNNYRGKRSIDDNDSLPALGVGVYPIYCVNLLDEHNINMPIFGNVAYDDGTPDFMVQSITIRGMNLQWPNSCPGHTDRARPGFGEDRMRATETQPGAWRGSIEFALDHTGPNSEVNLVDEPFFEKGHGTNIKLTNLLLKQE